MINSTGPGKSSASQKMSSWEDYLKQQNEEEECPNQKCPKENPLNNKNLNQKKEL